MINKHSRSSLGKAHWAEIATVFADLDPTEFPHLSAHAATLAAASPEERFSAGLAVLLDGIEQHARPR